VHPRLSALRLVAITDDLDGAALDVAGQARRAAALAAECPAGGLLVQVRAKALEGGALAELARAIAEAVQRRGALVLVNDRLDVALAIGADGVHLPERGLPLEEAAAIAAARPGFLLGCSRHAAADVAAAARGGAHLIHLGPIWATPSKAGMGEPLGPAALAAARAALGDAAALVAVGGVGDAARAAEARRAGAHAVAAIRQAWRDGASLL
jgi:thiamine-phosphate pyrophosphorylase